MISKKIARKKGTSDTTRLVYYILDAKDNHSTNLWVMSDENEFTVVEPQKKLTQFRITNCQANTAGMAIAEMVATQKHNTRSKADKMYHLMISFPEGERPTSEQLIDIENSICHAIGYEKHQRISAVHRDTENFHIHIAINKIHPVSYLCHEPYRDYYLRDKVCKELEIKHNLLLDNHEKRRNKSAKAAEMEYQGSETLLNWINKHAKNELLASYKKAKTWQELHNVLGKYNLLITPRGAGLVIMTHDNEIALKASSIDRCFSIKSLTTQLGPFEASKNNDVVVSSKMKYHQKLNIDGIVLYQEHQKNYKTTMALRREERTILQKANQDYLTENKAWYAARRNLIRNSHLSREEKRIAYKKLYIRQQNDIKTHQLVVRQKREEIKERIPASTWSEFLIEKAQLGDEKALTLLQRNKRREKNITDNTLTVAKSFFIVMNVELNQFVNHINKHGNRVYQLDDGGRVIDETKLIYVQNLTPLATLCSLKLAMQRFPDRPLTITGSDEFKHAVVLIATQQKLPIAFSDKKMENLKRSFLMQSKLSENSLQK